MCYNRSTFKNSDMGLLSKLLGLNNENDSNSDSPQTWTAKFLILSMTESTGEAPSLEELKEVIEEAFPEFPKSELNNLHSSVVALHKKSGNNKTEWDKIWDNFSSQLKNFKLSETFSVAKDIASSAYILKMTEGMEEVAETYVYRMSQSEKYLLISKQDFMYILKEEAENTGYNDYINNA